MSGSRLRRIFPLFLLLALGGASASASPLEASLDESCGGKPPANFESGGAGSGEATRWFPSRREEKAGVVLLVHGLNLKPSRMNVLAGLLQGAGMDVLRVSLTGHDGASSLKAATAEGWLSEVGVAYCQARVRAVSAGLPLFYLGYSLGGALGERLLEAPYLARFDRVVLLAPALDFHWSSAFVKMVGFFGKRIVIPSWSDPDYRAHGGTPVSAYEALFSIRAELEKREYRHANIPTLVLMDRKDELVPWESIETLMRERQLGNWKLFPVKRAEDAVRSRLRHLILDEESLGRSAWAELAERILAHLGEAEPKEPANLPVSENISR